MAASGQAAARKKPAAKKKAAPKNKPAASKKASARKPAASARPAARPSGKSEQPMMKALRAEHRHIASVMQLFADQLKSIEGGQVVDTHVVYEIMDYMATWPDRFHHPREDLIYGRVAEIDEKTADSVDSLQRDHDQMAVNGREILKLIESWREGMSNGNEVVERGRAYVDHMYEHMNLEEQIVFPQIESLLTVQDWRELSEDDQLRAVSDPVFGPRVQREFRNMARKLRRNVRRGVERGTLVEWISIEAFMESLEVMSMAYDSARSSTQDHVRAALDDARDFFEESPLTAPMRCALNNTKLTVRLLEDVAGISRDTVEDLSRVNRERLDRIRMLERKPTGR